MIPRRCIDIFLLRTKRWTCFGNMPKIKCLQMFCSFSAILVGDPKNLGYWN